MKISKRVKAISLFLCIMLMIAPVLQSNAFAETNVDIIDNVTWTYTVNGDGTCTITACSQTSGDIFIPLNLEGYTVTGIKGEGINNIFGDISNSGVTSVEIPSTIISIGDYAFYGCLGIQCISIPDSVTSIGSSFGGCTGLTALTFYGNAPTIASNAFDGIAVGSYTFYYFSGKTGWTTPTYNSNGVNYNTETILSGFNVNFNSNGGTEITSQLVNSNEKAISPANPTRIGYLFIGWYKESNFVTTWNFENDVVSSDVTLYAKWCLIGDINLNGIIDLQDVILMQNAYLGKIILTAKQTSIGDMNSNGNTNELSDCISINQLYLKS